MARQDQTIRYNVAVSGNKELLAIADSLTEITKDGGDDAAEAERLLEEIKQLAAREHLAALNYVTGYLEAQRANRK